MRALGELGADKMGIHRSRDGDDTKINSKNGTREDKEHEDLSLLLYPFFPIAIVVGSAAVLCFGDFSFSLV